MKKSVALLVAVMIAVQVASLAAHQASSPASMAPSGSTLYVGGDGPGNYTTIQAAVHDASHGDIVYVYEGLYQEHVIVNASITITGESTDVVVDAQGNGSALTLMAPTVAVHSLHLQRGGGRVADALVYTRFAHTSIVDCLFSQARQGVVINDTAHVVIDNCSFSRVAKGISLVSSTGARISNCTFYKNAIGIHARGSTDVEIRGVFSEQGGAGVMLRDVQNVLVERSTLSSNNENQANLYAEYSNGIHVENCHIHDSGFAVHFEECVDATMTGCHIHDNKIAVRFSESTDGVLSHSDVYANDVAVYVVTSENITVSHNNFYRNYVSTLAADDTSCDARHNWWGNRLGPVDEVHGSVLRVQTYPWLRAPENHSQSEGTRFPTGEAYISGSIVNEGVPAVDNDTDGDGVPDWWEEHYGYDPTEWDDHGHLDPDDDGLNNIEEWRTDNWGSHPFKQDVFIEVDVMNASYGLTDKKKQQMTERFARHNISLHIDDGWMGGSDVIPSPGYVNYATLVDLYWTYFLNEQPDGWRKGVFHYIILSDTLFKTMPGFVFIGWDEADAFGLSMRYYMQEIPAVFREHVHATVFMHELGHTLGLFHDIYPGIDNESSLIPFPLPRIEGQLTYYQYQSCMNYQYAWQILDYSDGSRGRGDFDDWGNLDLTFFQNSHWK